VFADLDISDELKDLLNRMFDVNAKTRITMAEVQSHPWLERYGGDGGDESDEIFFAEMRSRPTTVGGSLALSLQTSHLRLSNLFLTPHEPLSHAP
jgi:serine/threonine protein kinase